VPVEGNNEISLLAREFNQMCERLQDLYASLAREKQDRVGLERNLRQSEKLASVGQLAAGLAHEIGTPLNIIGGRADFLLRRPRSETEISDNLQIIRSQIDRITGIVRQLLEFSRRREPAIRAVELKPLVEKITSLLEHKIAERKASVDCQIPAGLPCIAGDPDQLQQVFLNLFLNALQALPPAGQIRIRAQLVENGAVSIPVDGAPGGLRIGHIHLRVGDVARAETFYRDGLGLDVTRRRHGASFMSSGRYHHHIAGNVWHSAGAGARDEDRAGLSWFSLEAADATAFEAAKSRLAQAGAPLTATPTGFETADPWGTRLRIERA
jgi:light-regulated signal transduction histidine kinase (bacteriophytochrome)